MHFALNAPNFGSFADARLVGELAHEAESAGWDGFFLWDHLLVEAGTPVDPWVLLTAMALATERIRLGTLVTPLPRRRPQILARETATLDQLSNGRLVLGIGLGDDNFREFSAFGEPVDGRRNAEMVEEGLQVLTGLWSGTPFSFEGKHYQVENALFLPTPVQQPRIPIWLAGKWPGTRPFQRAARWDGVYPARRGGPLTPEDCRQILAYVQPYRPEGAAPFVLAITKPPPPQDAAAARDAVLPFAEAGVTWYQVGLREDASPDAIRRLIRAGPPRL